MENILVNELMNNYVEMSQDTVQITVKVPFNNIGRFMELMQSTNQKLENIKSIEDNGFKLSSVDFKVENDSYYAYYNFAIKVPIIDFEGQHCQVVGHIYKNSVESGSFLFSNVKGKLRIEKLLQQPITCDHCSLDKHKASRKLFYVLKFPDGNYRRVFKGCLKRPDIVKYFELVMKLKDYNSTTSLQRVVEMDMYKTNEILSLAYNVIKQHGFVPSKNSGHNMPTFKLVLKHFNDHLKNNDSISIKESEIESLKLFISSEEYVKLTNIKSSVTRGYQYLIQQEYISRNDINVISSFWQVYFNKGINFNVVKETLTTSKINTKYGEVGQRYKNKPLQLIFKTQTTSSYGIYSNFYWKLVENKETYILLSTSQKTSMNELKIGDEVRASFTIKGYDQRYNNNLVSSTSHFSALKVL